MTPHYRLNSLVERYYSGEGKGKEHWVIPPIWDSLEKLQHEFKLGNAIFLLSETDGQIVGSIFGTHDGRKGWINRLADVSENVSG